MGFFDFLTEEIAIDLGTANTLIIHNDKVVVDSPSIVAIDRSTEKVIAIGEEANMMQGKTHENLRKPRKTNENIRSPGTLGPGPVTLLACQRCLFFINIFC